MLHCDYTTIGVPPTDDNDNNGRTPETEKETGEQLTSYSYEVTKFL